jgi:hypothetical protein
MGWWQEAGLVLFLVLGVPPLLFLYAKYAAMGWSRGRRRCERDDKPRQTPNRRRS